MLQIGYGAFAPTRNRGLALIVVTTVFMAGESANAEPATIAILGDSLVQGYGLPAEQGFVPQLQNWLNLNNIEAKVLNAGVSGDTTAGGLARVDWTLTDDVDALVVSLGANDALRGLDPATARANLDGILNAADKRTIPTLLVGIPAPGNYGPDYKATFDAIYPALSQSHGILLYPNFLRALTDQHDRNQALSLYFQPDALHPNADGVRLIVEDIGPSIAQLADMVSR